MSTSQRRQTYFPSTSLDVSSSLTLRFGADRIILDSRPGDWFLPVLEKICDLGTLPPNWNSYRAVPIRIEAAVASISILLKLLLPTDPHPSIVPTSRGGILIEWHENGIDLEIDVHSLSHVHLAFSEGDIQEEIDRASTDLIGEKLQMLRCPIK
jgi:hypothetical protein